MKQSSFFTTQPKQSATLAEIQTYLGLAQIALKNYPAKRSEIFARLDHFANKVQPNAAGDDDNIAKIHDRINEIVLSLKHKYKGQHDVGASPHNPEFG
ncbi:MAG: hypothetical protein AB8B83_06725 [Bdellovibrionales bacterium]